MQALPGLNRGDPLALHQDSRVVELRYLSQPSSSSALCARTERTDLAAVKMAFMMPLSFSSTSSLLQAMRALFCAISSPETATPPALAALAGPNSTLFLWYTAMACAHGSHVYDFVIIAQRLTGSMVPSWL